MGGAVKFKPMLEPKQNFKQVELQPFNRQAEARTRTIYKQPEK
jgi:hypothetical protein